MSWFPWGKEKSKAQKSVMAQQQKRMQELGLQVETGKMLEERQRIQNELSEAIHAPLDRYRKKDGTIVYIKDPLIRMMVLRKKIQAVDTLVRTGSIAWIRAGTDPSYRRAVGGYEKLLSYVTRDYEVIVSLMKKRTTTERANMELDFINFPAGYYFWHAMYICDMAFFDKDVSPTLERTLVIQQQTAPYGGGIVTPAREFQTTNPKPSDKAIAAELSSDIEDEGNGEGEEE